MSKRKKKTTNKKVVTKEVPFVTTSPAANSSSTSSSIQGSSMPSGTATSMSQQSMSWPAPDNWHLQGHDAAKKVALEYIVAASQYLSEQDVARKMELANKMTSTVESMIHGLQIGTEAGELLQQKIRMGDEAAKINMANLKQTLQSLANTVWIHNFVALRGAPGLQIRMIDGKLVGRTVRAVGIPLKDDGIPLPEGVDPNSLWLSNQPAENTQAMPMQEAPEDQMGAETLDEETPVDDMDEESGEFPEEEAPTDEMESEEEPMDEEELPPEEESPDEEAAVTEEPDDNVIPEDEEVEGIQDEEEATPEGEQILEDYIEPEGETEEEIPEGETEEEVPEEEPVEGEETEEEFPEETEEEGMDETADEEEPTTDEEEIVEEEPEEDVEEELPEEEPEGEYEESEGEPDEESVEEEPTEEETTEEPEEEESDLEDQIDRETSGESEEEPVDEETTEEDPDEEETQYCIWCDREVTQDDIDTCENEDCPFKRDKGNIEEEPVEEEEKKHYVLMDHDTHDDCEKYDFKSSEFTGLTIKYCKTCDKCLHYAFDQDTWTSADALKWVNKKLSTDKLKKKSVEEELIEGLYNKWIVEAGNSRDTEDKTADEDNIEEKQIELSGDEIKSALEKALSDSPLTKELQKLKDDLKWIVPRK